MHIGITRDALEIAERLFERLAERDPHVFSGVVQVDVEIALGRDGNIDAGMAGEEIQHVIEEADTGRNRAAALPVEIDRDFDVGFLGGAPKRGLAHRSRSLETNRAPGTPTAN